MTQPTRLPRLLLAGVVALALFVPAVLPHRARADDIVPPSVTAALQVPAGNVPFLVGHVLSGNGTQTYTCTGGAWGAKAVPDAILTDDTGTPIIHHTAGPVWTSLLDGSAVTGSKIANAASPLGSTSAIDWLLLPAISTTAGPAGNTLSGTTYIQRVNTTGGVKPTGGCPSGATQRVPYMLHAQ